MRTREEEEYIESPNDIFNQDSLEESTTLDEDMLDEDEEEVDMYEEDEETLLSLFSQNKTIAEEFWEDVFKAIDLDWDMFLLEQWDEATLAFRGDRPTTTTDITRKFVKSIVASTHESPPSVKLSARKVEATEKAKIISDAIRFYENRSEAKSAYIDAKEATAATGLAWLRASYEDLNGVPTLCVDCIDDNTSILMDPAFNKKSGEGANYFIEPNFENGCEEPSSFTYWFRSKNGNIYWAIVNGEIDSITDFGRWPSDIFPIVPVFGEMKKRKGKITAFGINRQLADLQHSYNYTMSEGITRIAQAPKSTIIADPKAIPDAYLDDWERIGTGDAPTILYYNTTDDAGGTIPIPTVLNATPDVAWFASLLTKFENQAKEITGIYNTSMGQSDSGGVEAARSLEIKSENGKIGQLVYDTNLNISIKQIGKVLMDLIDPVIVPSGLIPQLSEDGASYILDLTTPVPLIDPRSGQPVIDRLTGQPVMQTPPEINLDTSDLDIKVEAAKGFASRKEEGVKNIVDLMKLMSPAQQQAMMPKVIRNMPFPDADVYADAIDADPKEGAEGQQANPQAAQAAQAQTKEMMDTILAKDASIEELNMKIEALGAQLMNNTQAEVIKEQTKQTTTLTKTKMEILGRYRVEKLKIMADSVSDNKKSSDTMLTEEAETERLLLELEADAKETYIEQGNDVMATLNVQGGSI